MPMVVEHESVSLHSPKLRALLACTLVLPLGVSLLSPVLPVISAAFDLSDTQASLIITFYFLPGIVFSPILGLLADRFGRRTVLLPSLVVFAVAGSIVVLVDDFVLLLGLRMVQGVAAAGIFILTVTFISDVFDGIERNTVLGLNAACLFVGAAVFPFFGGILGNISWEFPFFTYLVAIPVAGYVYTRLDEPPHVECRTGPGYLYGASHALPLREAGALYGATFLLEAIAFGVVLTALPFILAREFGASPVVTGSIITSMMLVAATVAILNGRLVANRSNHRLIALSFCCYGTGIFGAWLGLSIPFVLVSASVVGLGFGMALPSVDAAIGRLAPAEYRAGVLSLRNTMTFLGRTVGPVTFTGLASLTGYEPLLAVTAAGTLCIGVAAVVVTDTGPRTLTDVPE